MGEILLDIRHLSKSFGTHQVLRDIDFTVSKGEAISRPLVGRPLVGRPLVVGRFPLWGCSRETGERVIS